MLYANINLQHQKSENETDVNTPGENAGTLGFNARTSRMRVPASNGRQVLIQKNIQLRDEKKNTMKLRSRYSLLIFDQILTIN